MALGRARWLAPALLALLALGPELLVNIPLLDRRHDQTPRELGLNLFRHLKPGSVLFGEGLPEDALDAALVWMRYADAVLVVGSSLVVHPVAALPEVALAMGASFVIVNEAPTDQDARADALVRARAGAAVPALLSGAGLLDGA